MNAAQLEELTGFISLSTLLLTVFHLFYARSYRGSRRACAIAIRVILPTYLTAVLVISSAATLLGLYLTRLFKEPNRAGDKAELTLVALAVFALFYSGLIGSDRRRRVVAVKIASIPCFGNGDHPANHRLLAVEKNPVLCFEPQYIIPDSPRQNSTSTACSEDSAQERVEKRCSTGITKRKVLEVICRSANSWVYGRPKRQAWPLNVVRTYRTKGKRFVLIKDETVQDGAGSILLDPSFTQSRELDKNLIGRVLYHAINRAAPCVLRSWHAKFDVDLFRRFGKLPAVICMLTGELREDVEKQLLRKEGDNDRCYVTELLWATIMVEVHDYLQYKRKDLPLLTWLTELPLWLCLHDANKIDESMDEVFAAWKAGRCCGKYLSRPCDSECCCHSSFSQTGCGCQCPCICNCP